MVHLRATKKVLQGLSAAPIEDEGGSDTALGDWYVNRVVVGRRPLLLLISSESLLPMLEHAHEVQRLPDRLPRLVEQRLLRLGIAPALVRAEMSAMSPVLVAPTCDRSVLGTQNDFARSLPSCLPIGEWGAPELAAADERLAETPCFGKRSFRDAILPSRKAVELLWRRWSSNSNGRRLPN